MPQALSGKIKSIPKTCEVSGDDDKMIIYKNRGNNHTCPFMWADEYTVTSGTTAVTISDDADTATQIEFYGCDLALCGNVVAQPLQDMGSVRWWIDKDTDTNIVKLKINTTNPVDLVFDVHFMFGADADVETLNCRGTGKGMPSLP
ncbi:MAG: hypothetical protein U9Q97_05745 [Acidobacteriota bacterium]|nr:hypothetical protein [Acidobacteriota bacterium]